MNKKLNWYPEFLKEGRFKHSVESAPDWNISRNRYWASAIPVWKCSCGEMKVVGSIKELKENSIKPLKEKIDLHKDFLDKVNLKCSCGKEMSRVPEVLDCWFESGSMTFAQFHYPFENKEFFEKNFPAQFVVEYIGQVRAWFYYMIALSAILFEDIPFENILTTGTILAKDGEKMSKSKNNFPDPLILVKKYGVDALRFYLMSSSVMNADNSNFSEEGVEEIYKKVLLLIYNVNNFYLMCDSDKKVKNPNSEDLSDKWIISRLGELIREVEDSMKNYDTIKACNFIRSFVEDLSTWYVKLNRERFDSGNKKSIKTLEFVLSEFSKVIAPVMPFVSEKVYQSIYGNKSSVHLESFPDFKKIDLNNDLIREMVLVREIVSLGLRERDVLRRGLKWPLRKVTISLDKTINPLLLEIVKAQLNVKNVEIKVSSELKVNLDSAITPELEAEGYAREVSRNVQAFRKTLGLDKKDLIGLCLVVDGDFKEILDSQKDFIKERTNSKEIQIVTTGEERFKNKTNFNIKDKKGVILIK